MTTWDRALYNGRLLPPRQQHQLESLVSEATGKPIRRTTAADQSATGSASSRYSTPRPASSGTTKARHSAPGSCTYYFPRTGLLIAVAANSSTTNDDLNNLAGAVYQTLHESRR